MKILFTGGYGNISWWCTRRALDLGLEVYLLNREQTTSTRRSIPDEAILIKADYRNFEETRNAIEPYSFDVVCDFLCQGTEHAEAAYELFKHKTKQYILISTESIFKRNSVVTEKTEKYTDDEASPYILGKLLSEKFFLEKYKKEKFPLTIVRPGYTLDTILPYSIGHNCYTVAQRYLDGKPILIAGSGNNRWTFTHSYDFAGLFVNLLGNSDAIGEDFNIMSNNVTTFNDIMGIFARTLIDKEPEFIHIPNEVCLNLQQFMARDLMQQRLDDALFDISKIRTFAPDWKSEYNPERLVHSVFEWLDEDDRRKRFNKELDMKLENLTNDYLKTGVYNG